MILPLVLDRHDPAPLTDAFLRVLAAAQQKGEEAEEEDEEEEQEPSAARIDRDKDLRILYAAIAFVDSIHGIVFCL